MVRTFIERDHFRKLLEDTGGVGNVFLVLRDLARWQGTHLGKDITTLQSDCGQEQGEEHLRFKLQTRPVDAFDQVQPIILLGREHRGGICGTKQHMPTDLLHFPGDPVSR